MTSSLLAYKLTIAENYQWSQQKFEPLFLDWFWSNQWIFYIILKMNKSSSHRTSNWVLNALYCILARSNVTSSLLVYTLTIAENYQWSQQKFETLFLDRCRSDRLILYMNLKRNMSSLYRTTHHGYKAAYYTIVTSNVTSS